MEYLEEDFITIETAKIAETAGFNIRCSYCFIYDPEKFSVYGGFIATKLELSEGYGNCKIYLRPTQSLLAKWLRKFHNIHIETVLGHDENESWYDSYVHKIELGYNYEPIVNFDYGGESHEISVERALVDALKLVIEKKTND